jgi:hypothetical protein
VLRDLEQVSHVCEARRTRERRRDVVELHRLDRVDLDLAVAHPIASTRLDLGSLPDAHAAGDGTALDTLAQTLGELHEPRQCTAEWSDR